MSLKQLFTTICIMLFAVSISAEVPNTMSYQGRLTDASGDPVADAGYLVKFIIYDASSGGTDLWNSNFQAVTTVDGLFSYELGSMVTLPNGIFSDTNRYLGLTVGADSELSPRTRFVTTSYSFKAQNADLASDADALGGSNPSFYLDWDNFTNVPAQTGISQAIRTPDESLVNSSSSMVDVITTTITIPEAGYIFLIAKCYITLALTTSGNVVYIQIDEESGGDIETPFFAVVGNSSHFESNFNNHSAALTRTYFKSAGSYTFRLEAYQPSANGDAYISRSIITALYIPTSYGTVTTSSSTPDGDPDAKMISITDLDGNTHTGYEIDLRNLELQVKDAQLKAKDAELRLMKAQQQQNRDEQ